MTLLSRCKGNISFVYYFSILILAGISLAGSNSDTTCGEYRVKEKDRQYKPDKANSNSKNVCADDSDSSSGCNGCVSPCFDFGSYLTGEMFKGIGNAIDRGSDPDMNGMDFSQFSSRQFRSAAGGGAGILHYPRIATGFRPEFIAHFYAIPSDFIIFRAVTGLDFSINDIYADFEQDVFVDSGKIGMQTYAPETYQNISMPLTAEVMLRPFGNYGSFHIFAGGGYAGTFEYIKGIRTATFNAERNRITCSAFRFRPVMSAGFGWLLMGSMGGLGNLEFRYSASYSSNRHHEPLPGENTSHSNSFCIEFTRLF